MAGLFRKEVLQKQGQTLFGDIVLASPISHMAVAALLVIIASSLVFFSIIGEYSRKERVVGFLTPDEGLIRISSAQTGVIEEVHVKVNQDVKKDDYLFSINTDILSSSGQQTAGTILSKIVLEKAELEHKLTLLSEQYSLTRDRMKVQALAARAEGDRLKNRIELQQRVVDSEKLLSDKFERLMKAGSASELEASNQESRYIQTLQSLQSLRNERQKFTDVAIDLEAQILLLPITEQQQKSEIMSRLNALEQRIIETRSRERFIIAAPVSGRIASLTIKEGQVADTQRSIATILPTGTKLEAELLVPSRAAGFVKKGQTVRVLYDAFPYQKFGYHTGVISSISRTVVTPSDLPFAFNVREPVFVVTVKLERQDVEANNEPYDLQAGMTLAADVILEERKIWQWALEPLLGAGRR